MYGNTFPIYVYPTQTPRFHSVPLVRRLVEGVCSTLHLSETKQSNSDTHHVDGSPGVLVVHSLLKYVLLKF